MGKQTPPANTPLTFTQIIPDGQPAVEQVTTQYDPEVPMLSHLTAGSPAAVQSTVVEHARVHS
jgi:hypothetical protein